MNGDARFETAKTIVQLIPAQHSVESVQLGYQGVNTSDGQATLLPLCA